MKYLMVFAVVVAVVITYILVAAEQPAVNSIITTVNASINGTAFPDMKAAVNSYPIYLWGIPGLVGVIAIVYYLKWWRGNGGG